MKIALHVAAEPPPEQGRIPPVFGRCAARRRRPQPPGRRGDWVGDVGGEAVSRAARHRAGRAQQCRR